MLSLLTQSITNAAFGIYFPRFAGTIYEVLSAPVSYLEIVTSYVGAAATKSIMLGLIILATADLFVPIRIAHPVLTVAFLLLTAVTFRLFGFIIGIWADSFEELQLVPLLIITPLTFLGGSFYSIAMLPPFWQKIALLNPDQRLALELLRHGRRRRMGQLRHGLRGAGNLPRNCQLDVPDGIQAEKLSPSRSWLAQAMPRLA